ncbi:MAG: bifunctional phosphoglucose/phosphomannose isomerase, partial [Nanoarchaeota archaeon]|nr:bifunctional phosphoglucose/phosphomannose isomerase [Nanoarchaeota archaeon]
TEFLKQELGEEKYSFKVGGTTSVDVTRKGLDKEWGIRKFAEFHGIPLNNILFFGDKLYPGGNDHAATRVVDCVEVKSPHDTLEHLKKLSQINCNNNVNMINSKYYSDIKKFPSQFREGKELSRNLVVKGNFNRVVVCGMGGSSLYLDLVKDLLIDKDQLNFKIEVNREYKIPSGCDENTLFVVASYSGNTEETLSCLSEIENKKLKHCIFCSGGKLLEKAKLSGVPTYLIPSGIQPRLSTGYFIVGLLNLLENCGLINDVVDDVVSACEKIDSNLNEEEARHLAKNLINHVPVIYGCSVNSSLGRVAKIKFNENAKTQAFWNSFPELNHNEMVGYSNLVMKPYFLLLQSQFSDPRNKKRMEMFAKLMAEKGLPMKLIKMVGNNVFAEMMNTYYFIDHVTYYLAQEYNIDPEPVKMVEDFKDLIRE